MKAPTIALVLDKVQTKPKLISNNFPDRSKFQIVSIVQKTTEIVRTTYEVLWKRFLETVSLFS